MPGPSGEYQVQVTKQNGDFIITSKGYMPTRSAWFARSVGAVAREVRVTMVPAKSFQYALFSQTTLDVKNGQLVIGDIYAAQGITIGTGATVCGSVINSAGGVTAANGAEIVKSYTDSHSGISCTGMAGDVKAGGAIVLGSTVGEGGGLVQGNATASAPAGVSCPPTPNTNYAVLNGRVNGIATACGVVTSTAGTVRQSTATAPPAVQTIPPFSFNPDDWTPNLACYPNTDPCSPSSTSTTAVSSFNAISHSNMSGNYAIWQTSPSQSNVVNLDGLTIAGDTAIITNSPITFGNTSDVTTSAAAGATLTIVSTYVPPAGSACTDNGGSGGAPGPECGIFGKNSVKFSTIPAPGIALLLYTPGKLLFKNQCTGSNCMAADGAIYAGQVNLKNNYGVTYDDRVGRVFGFGPGLEATDFQELSP